MGSSRVTEVSFSASAVEPTKHTAPVKSSAASWRTGPGGMARRRVLPEPSQEGEPLVQRSQGQVDLFVGGGRLATFIRDSRAPPPFKDSSR
jgi:hypothetical protein